MHLFPLHKINLNFLWNIPKCDSHQFDIEYGSWPTTDIGSAFGRLWPLIDAPHISVVCYHYLEAVEVHRLEVVRGASTPIDNVLVLALAAQFAVPVGDAQVVIHHALAVCAVLQHRVEERLLRNRNRDRETKLENCIPYSLSHHSIHREEIEQQQKTEIHRSL